jgi:hypothetical protein
MIKRNSQTALIRNNLAAVIARRPLGRRSNPVLIVSGLLRKAKALLAMTVARLVVVQGMLETMIKQHQTKSSGQQGRAHIKASYQ